MEKVIYALSSTRRRVRGKAKATGVARSGAHAAEATPSRSMVLPGSQQVNDSDTG